MHALTEKLLTFALGRGVEYYDMPVVRRIVADAKREGYRFRAIVLGVAQSAPFRMRSAPSRGRGRCEQDGGPARVIEGADMFITKKHLSRRTLLKRRHAPRSACRC